MFDPKKYAAYTADELMVMGYGALGLMAVINPGRFGHPRMEAHEMFRATRRSSSALRGIFHKHPSSPAVARNAKYGCYMGEVSLSRRRIETPLEEAYPKDLE